MTWLGILLLGAGVGLVYAAYTDQQPLVELRAALGGARDTPAPRGENGATPSPYNGYGGDKVAPPGPGYQPGYVPAVSRNVLP